MQSEVYLSSPDQPTRTIVLKQTSGRVDHHGQALYFSIHSQSTANGYPKCAVHLEPASHFKAAHYRKLHTRGVYGCLGLMHHANGK
ncbi:hypothetical protein BGZ94_009755 [Podila epigama]|nr:hypothetical protein BGZ94_009755 [Podila epigama]